MEQNQPQEEAADIFGPVNPASPVSKVSDSNVKKKRKKVVTDKQRKVLKAFVKDPTITLQKAGEIAGYSSGQAESARRALLSARERFQAAMDRSAAMQEDKLLEKIVEGFDAKETKFFAHEGQVIEEREVINYAARHAHLSLATKLRGLHPDSRMELTGAGGAPLIPAASGPDFSFLTKDQLVALATRPDYFVTVDGVIETSALPGAPGSENLIQDAQIVPADQSAHLVDSLPAAGQPIAPGAAEEQALGAAEADLDGADECL